MTTASLVLIAGNVVMKSASLDASKTNGKWSIELSVGMATIISLHCVAATRLWTFKGRVTGIHCTQKTPFYLLFKDKHQIFSVKITKPELTTYTIRKLGPLLSFWAQGWGSNIYKKWCNNFYNAMEVECTLYHARPHTDYGSISCER